MNFWTPTFHSWSSGFNPVDMPWYVLYDYVEVYHYEAEANEFRLHWRDDFNSFDASRWHKASGGFEANSSIFHPDNAYTKAGNLVLKMEPEPEHGYHGSRHYRHTSKATAYESLGSHFPRETLHAKEHHVRHHHYTQQADAIEIPPVHDAFVDSHLFSKHDD